ncbi:MAG: DNA polymerase III subunit alpha [Firmicutes bacterium]|nr:DNA polymerase III subunit alpha [Bacillota bacterium]MCL1954285.1 DNA polymerase III subunit alpha [Bacillota bacterium]
MTTKNSQSTIQSTVQQIPFVHLHLHTQFSLLDGALKIENLFNRCQELGQTAVAMTDHGNLFGAFEFFKAAVKLSDPKADPLSFIQNGGKWKVKPIIGCEVYVADNHLIKVSVNGRQPKHGHLILLAKNNIGYHNLVKLVSIAYKDGMYYKPRIDFDLLTEYHEGLICLSSCLSGRLSQYILAMEFDSAMREAERYAKLFGDDYYIEIQDHGLFKQKQVMPQLIKIANSLNIKLVATNDVHYLYASDAEMQKALQCISYRTTINQLQNNAEGDYQESNQFYLKSCNEMQEIFANFPDAIANTIEIANKCECDFFVKQQLLPEFIPPQGFSAEQYLRSIALDGLKNRLGDRTLTKELGERLDYELDTICDLGFVDYFLIVWDFIHFAESQKISVGPGRGSGAGSLVAYALGITKLDPIKYGLIFERFLNRERVSNPDFDIDFCVLRREEVIKYVVEKYGVDNVTQIVTFGTLAAKAAIKDIGRVYDYPYHEVDKITKTMPKMVNASIKQMLGLKPPKAGGEDPTIPDFVSLYNSDSDVKIIVDRAISLEGMPRQTGIHAAGVVICKDPVYQHIPIMRTQDDKLTTQFNMTECEQLGLLKMDFLGLNTLTDIDGALHIIKQNRGVEIDFYNMEYDDADVYRMIGDGDTQGVFQLESSGMRSFMRNLHPTNMEDIIAGIALYRPGPMDKIPEYVSGKRNPESIKYPHPILKQLLHMTYGVMVYQEQVMQIVQELAGYTLGRADIVRRLMSKKKPDEMAREKQIFLNGTNDGIVTGALARGVSLEIAEKVFEDMTSFANYAFNKSHAAAYAYLSYQTAYLKFHYPQEFFASILNNRITKIEETSHYLGYIKEKGIKILPPSINESFVGFVVHDDAIRVGMGAIKNVGVGFIETIISDRKENGKFKDFRNFISRLNGKNLNKKNMESMIWTGCFDEFGHTRPQLMNSYEQLMSIASKDKDAATSGQFSFFDIIPQVETSFEYPLLEEYPNLQKLKYEKEVAGIYLTGHPLDGYQELLSSYPINTTAFQTIYKDDNINVDANYESLDQSLGQTVKDGDIVVLAGVLVQAIRRFTKASKEMGVGRLEDLYGSVEVMVGYTAFEKIKNNWIPDSIVSIKGKVSCNDGVYAIWVSEISKLLEYQQQNLSNVAKQSSTTQEVSIKNDDRLIADSSQIVDTIVSPQISKFVSSNILNLKIPFDDDMIIKISNIQDVLQFYSGGDCSVLLIDTLSGGTLALDNKVDNSELLYMELCGLLGSENIVIQ